MEKDKEISAKNEEMMKMKTYRMKELEEGLEWKDEELDCTSLALEQRKR